MDDQHRHVDESENAVGGAAEQLAREARLACRRHHDQVDPLFVDVLGDTRTRGARARRQLEADAVAGEGGVLVGQRFEVGQFVGEQAVDVLLVDTAGTERAGLAANVDHREEVQGRVVPVGEVGSGSDGLACRLALVGRQ